MIEESLASLAVGSVGGFAMKFMAQSAKNKADQWNRVIEGITKADQSHDAALQRVGINAGKVARRIIVISVLFAMVFGSIAVSIGGGSTVIETVSTSGGYLWGLFPTWTEVAYNKVQGFVILPEVRQCLPAIVGFYFGQAAAKP